MNNTEKLSRGDHLHLTSKPTGSTSGLYKVTVGNVYLLKDMFDSCVITTSDEPNVDAIFWQGRVEKTVAPLTPYTLVAVK